MGEINLHWTVTEEEMIWPVIFNSVKEREISALA